MQPPAPCHFIPLWYTHSPPCPVLKDPQSMFFQYFTPVETLPAISRLLCTHCACLATSDAMRGHTHCSCSHNNTKYVPHRSVANGRGHYGTVYTADTDCYLMTWAHCIMPLACRPAFSSGISRNIITSYALKVWLSSNIWERQ